MPKHARKSRRGLTTMTMRAAACFIAFVFACCHVVRAERSLQQQITPDTTGLPEMSELVMSGNLRVVLPGIEFGLTTPLTWRAEAPLANEAVYRIWHEGELLDSGTQVLVDEDGNLITELEFPGLEISGDGDVIIDVELAWDDTFSQTSQATFEGFAIIGWLTLLPPIITIILAFATGEVLVSLFVGIWICAFLVAEYNPAAALLRTLDTYITNAFATDYRIQIILFSWFLSSMVTILYKGGGGPGLANLFTRISRGRRGILYSSFLLSMCLFVDDYSSCLLVGLALRPITDKNNISRERLAFHVHACATSFASLAPLSSWIGFEISLIQDAYSALEASGADLVGMGWQTSPFLVFIRSIPGRFYPIYLLVFIFLLILYNREFGPMYTAEKRALGGKVVSDTASTAQTEVNPQMEPEADTPLLWWNGAIPIATTVALIILGLVLTGQQAARADGLELTAANIFGNSDSFLSLLWGSFGGLVSCFFLFLLQHKRLGRLVPPSWLRFVGCGACGARADSRPLLTWHECMHWFVEGIKSLTTAVLVLVLAWSIGTALEACGTGAYVSQGLAGNIAGGSIPVLTFVLAACISFATGTSWGTMAILFPIAVPTQYAATTPPDEGLVTLTIAAILAGSIFGDQTTLISDSTILTCLSTRCDIRHHIYTEFPYALFVATLAILLGYLPAGLANDSYPNWAGLLVGIGFLIPATYLLTANVFGDRVDPVNRLFGWVGNYIPSRERISFLRPGVTQDEKLGHIPAPLDSRRMSSIGIGSPQITVTTSGNTQLV